MAIFFEHLVPAYINEVMNDLGLVRIDNLLEILILILTNFIKLPVLRYLGFCNVLYIWSIRAIPTYNRVYRLYDNITCLNLYWVFLIYCIKQGYGYKCNLLCHVT